MTFHVKANQEEGTDSDQLPEDECHCHVTSKDKAKHAKAEQRKCLKEAMITSTTLQMTSIFHDHFVVNVVFIKMTLLFMVIMSVIVMVIIIMVIIMFAMTMFSGPWPREMAVIMFLSG